MPVAAVFWFRMFVSHAHTFKHMRMEYRSTMHFLHRNQNSIAFMMYFDNWERIFRAVSRFSNHWNNSIANLKKTKIKLVILKNSVKNHVIFDRENDGRKSIACEKVLLSEIRIVLLDRQLFGIVAGADFYCVWIQKLAFDSLCVCRCVLQLIMIKNVKKKMRLNEMPFYLFRFASVRCGTRNIVIL